MGMRPHLIIGRLGQDDRTAIPTAANEVITRLDLVASEKRLGYGIGGALHDLNASGVFPTEVGLDLLILAALVHAADTRISRDTESQDSWTREIRLVVPVSNVALWSSTVALLSRLLNFLTGDRWEVEFRSRPRRFTTIVSRRPPFSARSSIDGVSLFSGGLDSLIGAIDSLEDGHEPLFVSHAGEGSTSDAQNNCFDALQHHYKRRTLKRLRVWMAFPDGLVRNVESENTTRGRSFLFIALGVFAGTGLDAAFALRVPENGLIALNVPLDPLRLGSLSTRTTHPFYMARWNELLAMLGIAGSVENPYWDKTKGEMVAGCKNRTLLRELTANALSCSSPTKGRWQGHGIEHCGYCLPCLIRRAALEFALGPGNDPTVYTVSDLAARPLDTRQAEGQQVRSLQFAIDRLRERPDLAKLLIHKPGPLTDEPTRVDALAGVYGRGMEEVAALLTAVRTQPS